jgi:hypothetical protein
MTSAVRAASALLAVVIAAAPTAAWTPAPDAERPTAVLAVPEDVQASVPARVEGWVLAADPERGQLLLATDAGVIALRAHPEDLAGLEVGDDIEVMVADESEPAAVPRLDAEPGR